MIGLEDMRCFVETVDCGGVNRAAARLGLSKSIVSRRIAAMEDDLGVQLVARSTRGVVPTEAGQEFRRRCERILAEVSEARDAVTAKGGDLTGRLRVTAPQAMGLTIIGPLLGEMARKYPRLQIDAVFTDRVVDLVGERFDLAIRIGAPRESSLIGRKIAPVQAVLIASPAYLQDAGLPKTPIELGAHQCIAYAGGGDWRFRMGRRWLSVRPDGRLRTDNGETIVRWATAGLGIGNVPAYLASNALQSGEVVQVLPDFPQPEFGIYTLRPPGPRAPTKVALLIEALIAQLKTGKGL
jgi:DNA-binding transcriptional LysR family regulator